MNWKNYKITRPSCRSLSTSMHKKINCINEMCFSTLFWPQSSRLHFTKAAAFLEIASYKWIKVMKKRSAERVIWNPKKSEIKGSHFVRRSILAHSSSAHRNLGVGGRRRRRRKKPIMFLLPPPKGIKSQISLALNCPGEKGGGKWERRKLWLFFGAPPPSLFRNHPFYTDQLFWPPLTSLLKGIPLQKSNCYCSSIRLYLHRYYVLFCQFTIRIRCKPSSKLLLVGGTMHL